VAKRTNSCRVGACSHRRPASPAMSALG